MKKKVLIASFFAILMLTVPLSSTIVAEDQISGGIEESEEEQNLVFQQADNLIPLTEEEIDDLLDLVDMIEDEETRLLAEEIVNRFITEDNELDIIKLKDVINDYKSLPLFRGLIGAIIEWIIKTVIGEVHYQVDGIITWYFMEFLNNTRLGWINDLRYHASNVTSRIYEIYDVWEDLIDRVEAIAECVKAIIAFLQDPCLETMGDLFDWLEDAIEAADYFLGFLLDPDKFPERIKEIKELIWDLSNATVEFGTWLLPDIYPYPGTGNVYDRPYNQPITIKGKITDIDPNDVELQCDVQNYTPNADGSFEMESNTTNKPVESYLCHNVLFRITNKATDTESEVYELAFSMGAANKTISFSGQPTKPFGPLEVERFTTQLYTSYAIDRNGDRLEYQWSFNGKLGGWSKSQTSGYRALGLTFWLNLGENEVKVRSKNSNEEISEWSEPITVTVVRRFLKESAFQQLQTFVEQTFAMIPSYQYVSQPTSQTSSSSESTTQQSTYQ